MTDKKPKKRFATYEEKPVVEAPTYTLSEDEVKEVLGVPSHDEVAAAQRVTAKVAKALGRESVSLAEKLTLSIIALEAIAAGPKGIARDIARTVLKVCG